LKARWKELSCPSEGLSQFHDLSCSPPEGDFEILYLEALSFPRKCDLSRWQTGQESYQSPFSLSAYGSLLSCCFSVSHCLAGKAPPPSPHKNHIGGRCQSLSLASHGVSALSYDLSCPSYSSRILSLNQAESALFHLTGRTP